MAGPRRFEEVLAGKLREIDTSFKTDQKTHEVLSNDAF